MKISVAKTAGFCMGVQRAVDMAVDTANTQAAPIYTYGPLIHNPQVLDLLNEKGISVLDEIPEKGTGTILIRAHGVPPDIRVRLEQAGYKVIDATCPRVIKVQAIIRKHAQEGYACIIVGDQDHPEVMGLQGFAGDRGHVVGRIHDLAELPAFEKTIIVAQTTQNTLFYDAVQKWAQRNHPHYKIFQTICDATERRQSEVKRLAEQVDAVVVVGGHNSGNTQRLAEIVRQAGKPAYHIETETELDPTALSEVQTLGVTAGASTPNWIIRRVYRAIESLPFADANSGLRRFNRIRRLLLLTNVYVAFGAGFLCFACAVLQNVQHILSYMVISFLYILSMHTLNNLTGRKEDRFNDPDRAAFYESNTLLLTLFALASGALGLFTAAGMGLFPFFLLFIMSLLGLSYNLKLIPETVRGFKYRRIRDIPGSKTFLIALAWGMVTALFPILSESGTLSVSSLVALAWATATVFVRTAFFDVLDMQGDRIVGKETLPILIGKENSLTLLRIILLFIFVILFFSASYELIPSLGYLLTLCPAFLFGVITLHTLGRVLPGLRLEFLTESQFILAGVITFIWTLFAG